MTVTLEFPDDLAATMGGAERASKLIQADLAVLYYAERRVRTCK